MITVVCGWYEKEEKPLSLIRTCQRLGCMPLGELPGKMRVLFILFYFCSGLTGSK